MFKQTVKQSNFWDGSNQKSLNKTSRKQELVKITSENQALLKRIQDKKATLNFRTLEKERHEKEKLLENISEYPYIMNKTNNTQKSFRDPIQKTDFVFTSGLYDVIYAFIL